MSIIESNEDEFNYQNFFEFVGVSVVLIVVDRLLIMFIESLFMSFLLDSVLNFSRSTRVPAT